jgi:hypothetical protein
MIQTIETNSLELIAEIANDCKQVIDIDRKWKWSKLDWT